jgi:uncharacterized protein
MATAKLDIRHNTALQRFEATVEDELAHADYRMDGTVMRMVHTEVPPGLEGRGIAGALVRAALEHARVTGLTVLPRCSYVRAYMRRHPETHSLLAVESPT